MIDSGPGYAGSPENYVWKIHTPDPLVRSHRTALTITVGILALSVAIGCIADIRFLSSIAAIILVPSAIWLIDILAEETTHRPRVSVCSETAEPTLRYRPTNFASALFGIPLVAPITAVYGWTHNIPEPLVAGIVLSTLWIALIIALAIMSKAELRWDSDTLRITTRLYERHCRWDDIRSISVTEKSHGNVAVRIVSEQAAVQTTWRYIRRRSPRTHESTWDILPVNWGTRANSLASTIDYVWQNPDFRTNPDPTPLTAMLRTPDWHV
ncbi:hypothetical protein [Nocardia sp. NPDC058666]|uniref:hypothetical protein n=1 Tax=unclassified Nocardia TaxID=2637762 RepID=UPI0036495DCE